MTIADQSQFKSPPERGVIDRPSLDSVAPVFVVLAILASLAVIWLGVVHYVVPAQLTLELFGKTIAIDNLHKKLTGGLILGTFLMLGGVFLAELVCVGWEKSSARALLLKRTKSGWSDIVVIAADFLKINHFITIAMTLGLGLVSGTWLHKTVESMTGVQFGITDWPVLGQVVFCYILYTFLDYWDHRIQHLPVFWPMHRFHHSAEEFHIVTASRVHPADLSSIFILSVPLMFAAPSAEALFYLFLLTGTLRFVVHSRIPSNFGWIGRWVLQSPMDHRMHHILDMSEGQGGNYSLLPLWDQLFGTRRAGGHPTLAIGVEDQVYRHGAWVIPDMLRDYWHHLLQIGRVLGIAKNVVAPAMIVDVKKLAKEAANDPLPQANNDAADSVGAVR